MRVVVVGGGSWGTAFAWLLVEHGHEVTLACRDPAQAAAIAHRSEPALLTEGRPLPRRGGDHRGRAVEEPNLVVVAVPSAAFRDVVDALPGRAPILSLTKGLDPATGERLSTLVRGGPVAVLSGPNIAEEIVRGLPAAAVVASDDLELAVRLQVASTPRRSVCT